MTNNELIDRYIYAVSRKLPASSRGDIEQELRGLISDMLDERCGEITPTETDVKVVLTELGTPSELALKYDPDGERSLIGPKYFRTWLRVLTIALAASTGGVVLASIIGIVSGEMSGWAEVFSNTFLMLTDGALSVFALVTAAFAIISAKNVDIDNSDDLSRLPAIPEKKEKIKKADCIIGIVICVILLPLLLYIPDKLMLGVSIDESGAATIMKLFRHDAFMRVWYLLVISFGASIVLEIVKLVIGRYNYKVAIASTVCNIVGCVTSALALLRKDAYDPQFAEAVNAELAKEGASLPFGMQNNIMMAVGGTIAVLIIVFSLIDVISCWVRAAKYSVQ